MQKRQRVNRYSHNMCTAQPEVTWLLIQAQCGWVCGLNCGLLGKRLVRLA